ncbi:MAG: glycosyl transferase family 1 [Actinobacteria bacterium 13_1_20CM_2_65_11]|nr:MAG: glycosyl transferase family 1 [Chloroflexi bacterium 13_1_40CM_3_65_12]OLD49993.1 MAG: glycosyl transferase family 1 [Actinobacteria bacterium 13_1_40CM_2_65_8]OLE78354.1 MAG: glycosyl transferase family 1 [Actinobacteria bacterium 13_1_20CM_2_65_11]
MHRVALMTREYPPDVYGGAGIHVEYLARELRRLAEVSVHCWGSPRDEPGVTAYQPWSALSEPKPESTVLQAMSINLAMVAGVKGVDLVHSHTWYANLGGHLAKLTWSVPHVVTTHSLEPLRPWKAEQLGGGYSLSGFCEQTGLEAADAVIAVSQGMRQDVLSCYPNVNPDRVHVIHNGVDPEVYQPQPSDSALANLGVDPSRPFALFAGRVTRQKGLHLLLAAAHKINPRYQLVIVASSPDTPEIGAEVAALAERVRSERGNLVWIGRFIPLEDLIHLYTGAAVFVCPSIYEPFGLVNLEAMACETAVVASRVGGIPEIVVEGETGYLVDYDPERPESFTEVLAARVDELLSDSALATRMGKAGRERVLHHFGWRAIAARTVALYDSLL